MSTPLEVRRDGVYSVGYINKGDTHNSVIVNMYGLFTAAPLTRYRFHSCPRNNMRNDNVIFDFTDGNTHVRPCRPSSALILAFTYVNVRTSAIDETLMLTAVQLPYDYDRRKWRVQMKVNNNNKINKKSNQNSCGLWVGPVRRSTRKLITHAQTRTSPSVSNVYNSTTYSFPRLARLVPNKCLVLYILILVSKCMYKKHGFWSAVCYVYIRSIFPWIVYLWLLPETFSLRPDSSNYLHILLKINENILKNVRFKSTGTYPLFFKL